MAECYLTITITSYIFIGLGKGYTVRRIVTSWSVLRVCHCYSYLFWSDGTNGSAKIERSDLSGNNRRVLVSSAQDLVSPTTLVVDFSSRKLYWLDSAAEKIGCVNFDGSGPLSWRISGLRQMSAMTIYRVRTKHLYIIALKLD